MRRNFFLIFLVITILTPLSPVQAQGSTGPIYIVQPGDSLSSIAARFNVSLNDLMSANNIADPNQLTAGQSLIIPGLDGVTGTLNTRFINFGDSYRSMLRQTQVPEDLFRKLNRVVSPSEFYVGVSMIVPEQEQTQYNKRISPAIGESLLEASVKNNSNPWTLAEINGLHGTWDGLPGDTLFSPGESNGAVTSGLPSAFISAEIRDLPIKQGGTGLIKVVTQPDVKLGGILVDKPLYFFPNEDGSQVSLQGVHALLEPGVYPLRLDATLPDGSVQSYEQLILIISGNYLTGESLPVDPSLIDPAVTDPEQKQLESITITTTPTPTRFWQGQFLSPAIAYAESTYFTSRYGTRRVYLGQGTDLKVNWWHTGVDFGGGDGLAITAPAAGQVIFAGPLTVRGNATILDHGWGVYSGFWHQSAIQVQVGQTVQQGDVIGLVGGTGRVTGAHLHWELWVNGVQVDPLDWLNQPYP
ncbi:MAG TPA: peptidoglycan DD-metalloendopeptidase family protein [Anaerolineales bacterium]|mgnify:FL=1|nr:peptidoglycan DD-metalloendopeptidase family protein [Anaerolineales bacterium]